MLVTLTIAQMVHSTQNNGTQYTMIVNNFTVVNYNPTRKTSSTLHVSMVYDISAFFKDVTKD